VQLNSLNDDADRSADRRSKGNPSMRPHSPVTKSMLAAALAACVSGAALLACDSESGADTLGNGSSINATSPSDSNGGAGGGNASSNNGGDGTHGDGTGGAGSPQSTGLPCDVDAVLAQSCRSCHGASPTAGAPDSLVTWDDLMAPAKSDPSKKTYELVGTRTHDDKSPMPPPPNLRLSAADQAVIDAWVQKGAPRSDEICGTAANPQSDGTEKLPCNADLHFAPPTPYTMAQNQLDQYVCYGVDVNETDAKHIVAFAPHIDNKKIVHHMLLFKSPTSVSSTPTPCSAGGSLQWSLMFGWAPGGKNMLMPQEAGYPLDANTTNHFVVQVHYNNALALAGQTDATGLDMCTSAPRKYDADVIAFGTSSFTIPPNGTLEKTCSVTIPALMAGRTFVAAMPHMHTLGTAIDTHLTPANGGPAVDMGTVANWNFQNQYWLPLEATGNAGDTITTHCAWKNTTGNSVKFGENTEDEMCYSFTMYYPKINAPLFSWMTPALTSSCN
jgi:hypothetical protein